MVVQLRFIQMHNNNKFQINYNNNNNNNHYKFHKINNRFCLNYNNNNLIMLNLICKVLINFHTNNNNHNNHNYNKCQCKIHNNKPSSYLPYSYIRICI